MLRIAGGRIATPSVRTGFAMTEVFGSFCTYFAASCIEKYVIPREHSDRGNLLTDYALSTRVVAGRLRGDSSLMFRMTYTSPTTQISRQSSKGYAD